MNICFFAVFATATAFFSVIYWCAYIFSVALRKYIYLYIAMFWMSLQSLLLAHRQLAAARIDLTSVSVNRAKS